MYHITLYHEDETKELMQYDGIIVPQVGDRFAGVEIPDGQGRRVISRLLIPRLPNYINVYVEYTYPGLIKSKKELTPTENY